MSGVPVIHNQIAQVLRISIFLAITSVAMAIPVFKPGLEYAYGEVKGLFLHLASLVVIGIFVYGLFAFWRKGESSKLNWSFSSHDLLSRPHVLIMLGLVGLLASASVSTLLSPLPKVSFFGAYDQYSGFNLYDLLTLSILLFAAFIALRKPEHFLQLLVVMATVGALVSVYGIAQYFGWDALTNREGNSRPPSSFENTLNFGAFLVLSIPSTAGLIISKKIPVSRLTLLVGLGLVIQFAALWFTGGRGPQLGALIGLGLVIGIMVLSRDSVSIRGVGAAVFLGVIGAIAIIVLIPTPTKGVDTLGRWTSLNNEVASIAGDEDITFGVGGLAARQGIWRASIGMFLDPETANDENYWLTNLRRVFGLGPDMFVHSYPIAVDPMTEIRLQANSHNVALQILVTLGVLGLTALMLIAVGILVVGRVAAIAVRSSGSRIAVLACIFVAVVIGKIAEMMVGVPRVSDLLPTFVMIGGIAAAGSLMIQDNRRVSISKMFSFNYGQAIAVAGAVMVVGLVLFFSWDLRRFSGTLDLANSGSDPETLGATFIRVHETVPDRLYLSLMVANMYIDASSDRFSKDMIAEGLDLLERARETLLSYESYNHQEFLTQFLLAKVSSLLMENGATQYREEMIYRYRTLAHNNPAFPTVVGTASTAALSGGDYNLALDLADQAIATENETKSWSKAWLARGISRYYLGDKQGGITDLLMAIKKEPLSEAAFIAHQALVQFYTEVGDAEQADYHRSQLER